MTTTADTLLSQLQAIVGAEHARQGGDLSAWEQDWRQLAQGRALAVVSPANTEQVAAVVQACAAAKKAGLGVSIVPQGGNTGLVLGSTPDDSGMQVVLSLRRMNSVRAIDRHNLSITVDAGCILQNVQEAAAAQGLLFPLSLAAEGSCVIGGNLAANAGGTQVVRYGNTRELCLGLEVVTADGQIWHGLSGLRKNNTGYDLRHLMIGSEGTLGIITAATMKLYPQPAAVCCAWLAVDSLQSAVGLLALAQQHLHSGLTGFETMESDALRLVEKHMPHMRMPIDVAAGQAFVLLEYSDDESEDRARARLEGLLEAAFEAELLTDGAVAQSLEQAQRMWDIREHITLAQAAEGLHLKHDISVPTSSIPAFVQRAKEALQQALPGARVINFGHLGDGNLHFNVQAPEGADPRQFVDTCQRQAEAAIYDCVAAFDGSFSAEHGVGRLKRHDLARYKDPVALGMMRAIKTALDPLNLLNPHALLPDAAA
ncbi:FAD-binding oxidoreductase [Vandammella animalimorsus]|uniref:Hydroxyacid dehydrogenase n=1 Tax=Vandammella animalimorsus TaxID=2029117 RepID=A0A2A2AAQ1_9BURK|nr:FAD-binding oxidoreductase [Vandammella animalimorsus]PAT34804.1 hydroxyacid dehydrogenase [Vandammella animalimorsus]RRD66982.1 FAD-binding oxidoreductase [Comamonadaceae bacterium OH2310_COT-174]